MPARSSRRLIWILAGVATVLLLAISAGVGLMLGQRGSDTSAQSAVQQIFAPKPESLRSAAERMDKEGDAIEAAGSSPIAQKKFVEYWAEPSCAAMINAFVEAFAGSEDDPATPSAPSRIISVNESGDKGTVVTESAGETETQHWVRLNGRWMITCEGAFGDESSTPTQADDVAETALRTRPTATPRSESTDHQRPVPLPSPRFRSSPHGRGRYTQRADRLRTRRMANIRTDILKCCRPIFNVDQCDSGEFEEHVHRC